MAASYVYHAHRERENATYHLVRFEPGVPTKVYVLEMESFVDLLHALRNQEAGSFEYYQRLVLLGGGRYTYQRRAGDNPVVDEGTWSPEEASAIADALESAQYEG